MQILLFPLALLCASIANALSDKHISTHDFIHDQLPAVNRSDTAFFDPKRSLIPALDSIDGTTYIRLVFHVYRRIRFSKRTRRGEQFKTMGAQGIMWDRDLVLVDSFPPQHPRLVHPYTMLRALNAIEPPPESLEIAPGIHVMGFLREWTLKTLKQDARRWWWPRRKWVTYLVWIPAQSALATARTPSLSLSLQYVRKSWWRNRLVMKQSPFVVQVRLPEKEGQLPSVETKQMAEDNEVWSEGSEESTDSNDALEAKFKKAAFLIQHGPKQHHVSKETKLKYYALYKQATSGDNNQRKPGLFEIRALAMWHAWANVKGMSKQNAMQQYIHLIATARPDWEQHPALENYHE